MTPEEVAAVLSAFGQATGPAVLTGILLLLWKGELVTKGHLEDEKRHSREIQELMQRRIDRLINGEIP